MKPLKHQAKIIKKAKNRQGLFFDTGAGKTYTALWCLEKLERHSILIVCPLMVHKKWIEDIGDLYPSRHDVQVIVEGRFSVVYSEKAQYLIMTKEYFRDKWETEDGIDGVIFDEAHFIASPTAKITKKFFKYVNEYEEQNLSVYLLTATPFLSTPWNVFTLGRILGYDWNYASFKKEMFYQIDIGPRYVDKPKPDAPKRLEPYLKAIGVFVSIFDVIEDLPPQKITVHSVELTEEQRNAIQSDESLDALGRMTKIHQIENGYVAQNILAGRPATEIANKKKDWVLEYVNTHKYVAVVCRYRFQMSAYEKMLTEAGHKVYVLNGDTKNRDKLLEDVRTKQDGVILIQAMVSEGYELPEIEHVIFASMDWSYKNYIQMMGRFLRVNKPTPTEYHILCSHNVDNRVYDSMQKKKDFYPK